MAMRRATRRAGTTTATTTEPGVAMLKRMILHTLLAALVIGALAAAYQARADGAAGIVALLTTGNGD